MAIKAIVIVAGVGPGTGSAIARKFDAAYSVALLAHKRENYEGLVKEINERGGRAIGFSTNVSSEESVKAAFSNIHEEYGNAPIAAAIFNAPGIFLKKPLLEMSVDEFGASWRMSCKGAFILSQATLPGLLRQATDINALHPPTLIFTNATAAIKANARVSGQECQFDNDIRFKHSHSKTEKQSRREWAKVPSKISFTAPRGIEGMVLEESGSNSTKDEAAKSLSQTAQITEEMVEVSVSDLAQSGTQVVPLNPEPDYRKSAFNFIANSLVVDPSVHNSDGYFDHATAQDLPVQVHIPSPYELTEREAFLFMIYIYKCAPLSDACDNARHFELEVPRLALRQPMIMNGLLALASRYDSRCMDTSNDIESTFYHNKCIKLLIEAFAQPPETWDSTLLTAVVIARLYEENENETDSYYHHLSGTQNLLNHEAIASAQEAYRDMP
ncbi:hypothetical protein FAUST_11333 [Fusarium austroamericanum]|uniref:Uncharacterized protein n=1 Tax=Fusarium austroamericanum TaxID=282268 RepID=A0AAN5YZG2_FUSAU|nr:hypothetical protein FAUST_11333 [Fusarium austroamericanum]